jgi:hypothetical protein
MNYPVDRSPRRTSLANAVSDGMGVAPGYTLPARNKQGSPWESAPSRLLCSIIAVVPRLETHVEPDVYVTFPTSRTRVGMVGGVVSRRIMR